MHGRELLAEGITGGLGGCRAENRIFVQLACARPCCGGTHAKAGSVPNLVTGHDP